MNGFDGELYGFILAVAAGIAAAAVLQFVGFGRRVYSRRFGMRTAIDLLGITVFSCFIVVAVLVGTGGELRMFTVLGMALGMVIYMGTAGAVIAGLLLRLRPSRKIRITDDGRRRLQELSGDSRKNRSGGELS